MENSQNQPEELRKQAELEEALQIWAEMRQVDPQKGWARLSSSVNKKSVIKKRFTNLRLVAAVATLLVCVGGLWWMKWSEKPEGMVVVSDAKQPRLILYNGEEIALGLEKEGEQTVYYPHFVINRKEKNIICSDSVTIEEKERRYNLLDVPRGAEYELVLPDGTHVWLNADSRLRFPTHFDPKERKVYLVGEAYFQVAKEANRPFRVEVFSQVVEVLGTEFNVYAYQHENLMYTTLVEGRVAIAIEGSEKQQVLLPGQQAVVGKQDGSLVVHEVNIAQVVDWKNGMFVFDEQSLEVILRKAARWYDVEISYENLEAKSIVFKGNLPRYGKLPELLKILESSSDIHFTLEENRLVVK